MYYEKCINFILFRSVINIEFQICVMGSLVGGFFRLWIFNEQRRRISSLICEKMKKQQDVEEQFVHHIVCVGSLDETQTLDSYRTAWEFWVLNFASCFGCDVEGWEWCASFAY